MTDTEQQLPDTEQAAPEANGAASASILDDLRQLRREKVEADVRQITLLVPGYDRRLAVIYRYPDDGYERVIKAVENERAQKPDARIEAACKVLVACCAAIVGKDGDGASIDPVTGALVPEHELPENVLRFDRELAGKVDIEVPPEVKGVGRHVCRQLYSPRGAATGIYDGDVALIATSNVLFNWLTGAEVEIDEELAGE